MAPLHSPLPPLLPSHQDDRRLYLRTCTSRRCSTHSHLRSPSSTQRLAMNLPLIQCHPPLLHRVPASSRLPIPSHLLRATSLQHLQPAPCIAPRTLWATPITGIGGFQIQESADDAVMVAAIGSPPMLVSRDFHAGPSSTRSSLCSWSVRTKTSGGTFCQSYRSCALQTR